MSIHMKADSLIYAVADDSNVQLRIVIGDAQGGGWVVAWDAGHILAKGSEPDVVSVGKGKDLRNKSLQIRATVVDVRPETNRLSSTVSIEGGSGGPKKLVHSYDGGGDGDAAIFATTVQFQ